MDLKWSTYCNLLLRGCNDVLQRDCDGHPMQSSILGHSLGQYASFCHNNPPLVGIFQQQCKL